MGVVAPLCEKMRTMSMNSYVGKAQDKGSIDVASCINFVNVIFEGVCCMSPNTIESSINYTLINPDSACSLGPHPLKPPIYGN